MQLSREESATQVERTRDGAFFGFCHIFFLGGVNFAENESFTLTAAGMVTSIIGQLYYFVP